MIARTSTLSMNKLVTNQLLSVQNKYNTLQQQILTNTKVSKNKKQQTFQTNGLYLLKISNTYVLRRIQEIENNQIYLIADNKNYIYQTIEKESLEIVGVAIHIFNSIPL